MKNKKNAFTLVELIVVITILAILATVGFISFQGYSQDSRDVKRTTDIKTIEQGLNIFLTNKNYFPVPDSQSNVTLSGTLTSIQGEVGKGVLGTLKVSQNTSDPVTKKRYFYSINSQKNNYSLSAKLENSISFLSGVKASNNIYHTKGGNVGIILDDSGNILSNDLEINTILSNSYLLINNKGTIDTVGADILSTHAIYNNKSVAKFSNSLIGYWDMQTLTEDGKLADLSNSGNHGNSWGVNFGDTTGISGKSTNLNGYSCIKLDKIIDFRETNKFTISMFVNNIDPINSTGYFFYNGQFFTRTRPEIENGNRNYEAFLNDDISPEPRLLTNTSTLNVNNWDHLGITWDGEKFKYYINGKLSNEILRDIELRSPSNTSIGCVVNSTESNVGGISADIDEVKIFNRTLESMEIYNLYQNK